jgi:hypothetical protein
MRNQEGEQCPGQKTASMIQRVWQKAIIPLLAALVARRSPWTPWAWPHVTLLVKSSQCNFDCDQSTFHRGKVPIFLSFEDGMSKRHCQVVDPPPQPMT